MWIPFGYLIAAVLFILGLKKLSHPRTAPLGNRLSSLGMAVAIGTALVQMEFGTGPITNWNLILLPMGAGALIGLVLACKAKTTSGPDGIQTISCLDDIVDHFRSRRPPATSGLDVAGNPK